MGSNVRVTSSLISTCLDTNFELRVFVHDPMISNYMYPMRSVSVSVDHTKALDTVQRRHQNTLPKVQMRDGTLLRNSQFGQYRMILHNKILLYSIKVSIYKGKILFRSTYDCEVVILTGKTLRRYKTSNTECCHEYQPNPDIQTR